VALQGFTGGEYSVLSRDEVQAALAELRERGQCPELAKYRSSA